MKGADQLSRNGWWLLVGWEVFAWKGVDLRNGVYAFKNVGIEKSQSYSRLVWLVLKINSIDKYLENTNNIVVHNGNIFSSHFKIYFHIC